MSATIERTEYDVLNQKITDERDAALVHVERVAVYRAYVLGEQKVTISEEMKADLGNLLRSDDSMGYTDNLCKLAVTTAADFLSLARIEIDSDNEAERMALEEFIGDTSAFNQLGELESKVNIAAYRDGDHVIGLHWLPKYPDKTLAPVGSTVNINEGRVRIFTLPAWNGTTGSFVHYGEGGLADWAVDEWNETVDQQQSKRRDVWFPNRVERYRQMNGGAWEPYLRVADRNLWPFPNTFDGTLTGEPVGIPRVHFPLFLVPNHTPGTGNNEADSRYGLSLLSGGAIGVQDALTDAYYDLIVAARRSAFPVYTATGVSLPPDPANPGKFLPLEMAPGSVASSPSADAKFGILQPGDMSPLINVISVHTRTFSRLTSIPMQIVNEDGTDAQSGVALYRLQMAAVRQAQRTQKVFASRWGMVFHKAVQIARAFGKADLNPDVPLIGAYDPIEVSDLAAMAEVAQGLALAGYPFEYILEVTGQTPENVKRIMDMKRGELVAANDAVDRMLNAS